MPAQEAPAPPTGRREPNRRQGQAGALRRCPHDDQDPQGGEHELVLVRVRDDKRRGEECRTRRQVAAVRPHPGVGDEGERQE